MATGNEELRVDSTYNKIIQQIIEKHNLKQLTGQHFAGSGT